MMKLSSEAAIDIMAASADALILVDDSGSIVFVNQRATEVFGYAEDEMLGNAVEMLVPTNMRDLHASHRNEYHDAPHSRPLVSGLGLKAQHKDGRQFDVEIALTPIISNARTYACSIVRDLTAIDTSEAYFQNLLETAPDAMIIIDEDGAIVIANGQAERMFGYARRDLIGMQIEELIPQRYRDKHVQHRSGYVTHAEIRPMGSGLELAGRRAEGSEFPVEISLSPVDIGASRLVSSVIRDVTERKLMEGELIEARKSRTILQA